MDVEAVEEDLWRRDDIMVCFVESKFMLGCVDVEDIMLATLAEWARRVVSLRVRRFTYLLYDRLVFNLDLWVPDACHDFLAELTWRRKREQILKRKF
jgi:hypothetical protein